MAVSEAKINKDRVLKEFDAVNGTNFADWIYRWELYEDYQTGDQHGYEPTYPIDTLVSDLTITAKDKVMDIGCGKGYAMYLLDRYSFGQVDGVELHPDLASIAKSNMEILFNDNKHTVYEGNATEFDGYGNYNYFFFYNPFGAKTTELVLNKIIEANKNKNFVIIAPECENLQVFIDKNLTILYNNGIDYVFTNKQ